MQNLPPMNCHSSRSRPAILYFDNLLLLRGEPALLQAAKQQVPRAARLR